MTPDIEIALDRYHRRGWKIIIIPESLPWPEHSFLIAAKHPDSIDFNVDLTIAASEKQAINIALAVTSHNKYQAAKRLGISKGTLYRKMDRYEIGPMRLAPVLIGE